MNIETPLDGLLFFIKWVETLPSFTKFVMCGYDGCVIGKYLSGDYEDFDKYNEELILKKFFNINVDDNIISKNYFAEYSEHHYSPEDWKIIRLFTTDIGEHISAGNWLSLAKETVENIQNVEI